MPSNLLTAIAWLLLAGSAIGCVYLGYASLAVRRFAARPHPRVGGTPPVTVLKPLCGEDPGLAENLRSFCRQDHGDWQIVFGVQDRDDPAIGVVRRLMAEFPQADLTLVVERAGRAGNLKVANLLNMVPAARHELIVMADSDMRVGPGYLAEVIEPLSDPQVGLVTCLYRGLPVGGLWSRLACLHVDHGFLPQALVGEALGAGAGCFGATIAFRRTTLDAIGGFTAVADELADDHALGAAVRRLGVRVVLSPHVVDNIIVEPSLGALFRHELRWARTIRLITPAGYFGSILTQPVVLALFAVALGALPAAAPAGLALALLVRYGTMRLIDRALGLPGTPAWLVPVRDLLSFAVFAASFFTRTVAWRDRTFRIGRDGQLSLDGDTPL
jgi:ceramide glucosyltransferase